MCVVVVSGVLGWYVMSVVGVVVVLGVDTVVDWIRDTAIAHRPPLRLHCCF